MVELDSAGKRGEHGFPEALLELRARGAADRQVREAAVREAKHPADLWRD